jgi:hypothetical protein
MGVDENSDWCFLGGGELASWCMIHLEEHLLEVDDLPEARALRAALAAFSDRAGEMDELAGTPWGRGPGEEMAFAVLLCCWLGHSIGDAQPMPAPVPEPEREWQRRLRLTPRHGSAHERRGLFGAVGPDPGGFRPA